MHAWQPPELAERYVTLLETIHSLGIFAGFCYTQFADTYQEANGLSRPTADRSLRSQISSRPPPARARRPDSAAGVDSPRQMPAGETDEAS